MVGVHQCLNQLTERTDGGRPTCGKVLIDWPVVHLERSVASVPGESHQMVFAIVYGGRCLLDADVHCPNVECHADFSLFLKKETHTHRRAESVIGSSQSDFIKNKPLF